MSYHSCHQHLEALNHADDLDQRELLLRRVVVLGGLFKKASKYFYYILTSATDQSMPLSPAIFSPIKHGRNATGEP